MKFIKSIKDILPALHSIGKKVEGYPSPPDPSFSRKEHILDIVKYFNKSSYAIKNKINVSVRFTDQLGRCNIGGMNSYHWYTKQFLPAFSQCTKMICFGNQPIPDRGLHRAERIELDLVISYLRTMGGDQEVFIEP